MPGKKFYKYDSLLPEKNYSSLHVNTYLDLLDAENNFKRSGNIQKTMFRLLRIAGLKKTFRNNTLRTRLFSDLANISIRLKMYPLAMKCYNQATRLDTDGYSQLIKIDSTEIVRHLSVQQLESPTVNAEDIQCSFEDGKTASSYAVIIHVKQPVPGHRKAFRKINIVGHTFITLIKLNDDNSYVSRSFGFYPAKKRFLSATPVHPRDGAVIKDDALHPWDETVGKFISEKKFDRILTNLEKFSKTGYNLNNNNCTDFGLSEATIAGIDIRETSGSWPLGKGNNPANAGQSLLEKKFENLDNENPGTITVNESQIIFNDSD